MNVTVEWVDGTKTTYEQIVRFGFIDAGIGGRPLPSPSFDPELETGTLYLNPQMVRVIHIVNKHTDA